MKIEPLRILRRAVRWLVAYWVYLRRGQATLELEATPELEVPPPAPEVPARRVARPTVARPNVPESASWHFRGAILDRLDEYFTCLRRVRLHDPSAYEMFSRVGLSVPADTYANPDYTPPAALQYVAFGGVLCNFAEYRKDCVYPSFLYFRKVHHPSRVQAWNGEVYQLTVVYDHRLGPLAHWRSKRSGLFRCHIGVGLDGSLTLLKEVVAGTAYVQPQRRGHRRKPQGVMFRTQQWQYPEWVADVAADLGHDPLKWATGLLVMALVTYCDSLSRIVIRVHRHDCTAAFGIELPRAKYFFADREATALAADGKRKRIFHAVTAHDRDIHTRVVRVRAHYRGTRQFDWNGYTVRIVLPANADVLGFEKPAYYEEDAPPAPMLTEQQTGERFAAVLET